MWYTDTNWEGMGAAFGFATEISPGAAPLTLDSMKKTVAADALWDPEVGGPTEDWSYHCGADAGAFGSLIHFTPGINARYGNGTSAADYLKKSQLASYESHRAMFEAYSRNKYNSTGLIQWMLNSAWPSNMWHLFDYYLQMGGSGFGAKKACAAPVHLLFSYPSQSQKECGSAGPCENDSDGHVWAINSLYTKAAPGLVAEATQFALDGTVLHTKTQSLAEQLEADAAVKLFRLNIYPPPAPPTPANKAGQDCEQVADTETEEDQYKVAKVGSANECCHLCLKDGQCTHAVKGGDGSCYLKNMKKNDHGNTMTPIRGWSAGCTLCIKREPKPTAIATAMEMTAKPHDGTILLRLHLTDASGKVVDENWYWLPPVLDKFEDLQGDSCFTGCKIDKFADMRDLVTMPAAPPLTVALGEPGTTADGFVRRTVKLAVGAAAGGSWLAFFVRLRALDAHGDDVLPAMWSDNFVSCRAGESVTVTLKHEPGMNVAKVTAEPFNEPGLKTDDEAPSRFTSGGVTFEPPVFIGAGAPHDGCMGYDASHLSCGAYFSEDGARSWQPANPTGGELYTPAGAVLRVNASGPTGPSTELVSMGSQWGDALDWANFHCEKSSPPQPKHAQFICTNYTAFYSRKTTVGRLVNGKPVMTIDNGTKGKAIRFDGIPQDLAFTCGTPPRKYLQGRASETRSTFGCPFRLGGRGIARQADGNYVQTVITYLPPGRGGANASENQNGPFATSVVAFSSTDGYHWRFLSVVLSPSDPVATDSEEGPNECDLAMLADGLTLLAVIRIDGGDGQEPGAAGMPPHAHLPYVASRSTDGE